MISRIKSMLQSCRLGDFELIAVGSVLTSMSIPTLGLVFWNHDVLVGANAHRLRQASIVIGFSIFLLGVVVIFLAWRRKSISGSLVYRITHPRFWRSN